MSTPTHGGVARLSVVIPNHNYGAYIEEAIASALNLDWPDVQVIVVDDGSTDRSREVIESFGSEVSAFFQEQAGPREACNRGFAASDGDAVIFLDSDDVLDPRIGRAVAENLTPGVSKVQFQMARIDGDSRPLGSVFPAYPRHPSAQKMRSWMLRTGAYPTPPGSGNAYARWFLESLFPLDDSCGDATDSICLAAAPLLGDVATVPEPLVSYRVHGSNRSGLSKDPGFCRSIRRAVQRHTFACRLLERDLDLTSLRRGRHLLQMRAVAHRLSADGSPFPGESTARLLADALRSPVWPGPEGPLVRAAAAAWTLAVLAAPRPAVTALAEARFGQGTPRLPSQRTSSR